MPLQQQKISRGEDSCPLRVCGRLPSRTRRIIGACMSPWRGCLPFSRNSMVWTSGSEFANLFCKNCCETDVSLKVSFPSESNRHNARIHMDVDKNICTHTQTSSLAQKCAHAHTHKFTCWSTGPRCTPSCHMLPEQSPAAWRVFQQTSCSSMGCRRRRCGRSCRCDSHMQ